MNGENWKEAGDFVDHLILKREFLAISEAFVTNLI